MVPIARAPTDISVFVPDLKGGGAERVMARLANGLSSSGAAVDMICLRADGVTAKLLHPEVRLVELGGRMRTMLPKLIAYLRRERPRGFLVGYDHHCTLPILGARLALPRAQVVATVHTELGPWLLRDGAGLVAKRTMVKVVFPMADHVVGVSDGIAQDLKGWSRGLSRRVCTVPNPVLSNDIRELALLVAPHPWLQTKTTPVLLALGRLTYPKDWPTLIRAFALLRARVSARLILLGEGPQRDELLSLAAALGVAADVSLPGWAENPYAYIARADVVVHSSLLEGSPTVLIEALGLGVPVVATDCASGVREILDDGRWGRIVPSGCPGELGAAVLSALHEHHAGAEAASFVWQRFSAAASVSAYATLLLG